MEMKEVRPGVYTPVRDPAFRYTRKAMIELTGVTEPVFKKWQEERRLRLDGYADVVGANWRRYTSGDVIRVALMVELVGLGVDWSTGAEILNEIAPVEKGNPKEPEWMKGFDGTSKVMAVWTSFEVPVISIVDDSTPVSKFFNGSQKRGLRLIELTKLVDQTRGNMGLWDREQANGSGDD